MITFKRLMETVDELNSDDEQRFRDKHVIDKNDHPVADEGQFVADLEKDLSRYADYEEGEDEEVYEEKKISMSDLAIAFEEGTPLEEISKEYGIPLASVKSLAADWKRSQKRSFKEWRDLTEVNVHQNAFTTGSQKLKDGSTITISKEDSKALANLFATLNDANASKMHETMLKSKKDFNDILSFAKEV